MKDLICQNQLKKRFFALIADEYTDISNREQLSLCLRWVDDALVPHETFLGFYEVPNIQSTTIVKAILDVLVRLEIPLDNCRGQCYDGASNMMGKKSGVAQQIKDRQPKSVVTHCHAHSLSLGVKDVVKDVKILSDTMSTTKEIVTLVKYSPKRQNILGNIRQNLRSEDDDDFSPGNVLKFCPTRWTVTAKCYKRILDNYDALLQLWDTSLTSKLDSETRARIIGCQSQMMTFDFFFAVYLSQRIFAHTDNLAAALQSRNLSAAGGKHLAELTIKTLQSIRNEESFDNCFSTAVLLAKKHDDISEPKLPRKRRVPTRFETGTADPTYHETPRDHYRQIYLQAVDHAIVSISDRFEQPAFQILAELENLLINSCNSKNIAKELEAIKEHYTDDIDYVSLEAQLATFAVMIKDVIKCFQDVVTQIKELDDDVKPLIGEVIKVCSLILVNPATSASGERSFSTARRIKSYTRATMTQARFNHLTFLNIHKDLLQKLNIIPVANQFVALNSLRQQRFGRF